MNVIFGSGIIGLLAKHILGDNWKLVPFAKSRFFSFNPSLDDNFIICSDDVDRYIGNIASSNKKYSYSRAWSIDGQIYKQFNNEICCDWLNKLFDDNYPRQSPIYYNKQMGFDVYDIRINHLYNNLLSEYYDEIMKENEKGIVTSIGDHYYIANGIRYDFDYAISTIPLDALYNLSGIKHNLTAKTVHYVHVATEDLNFDGVNQLLVVDRGIEFYKCTNVSKDKYLFYFHNDPVDIGIYLMQFMNKFDIIDGTSVKDAIPCGPIPDLTNVENNGIFCVGSNAQWDWCMDVGSCIYRILKYANRFQM